MIVQGVKFKPLLFEHWSSFHGWYIYQNLERYLLTFFIIISILGGKVMKD